MSAFLKPVEVRWSDLDPNFHLRHSVYYDYGAFARISFLEEHGLTAAVMAANQIGPILFREECVFKREIRLGDTITIDVELLSAREDQSRWSIRHNIWKNGDTLSAVLTVDGAWIDVAKRKLTVPPDNVLHVFNNMPRAAEFSWINK
ncbi:acyl-CoA thioesterase [Pseudobacter ginsenosidimutans]|uniref:Acyl-CoA thioester hydrolase n=1 Tax=Pseudobacter ginsenosidimutans TaxID=661488 RepID=A0A4Q7MEJ3_9BACT|nr:acyl-CoA thioesterase [Pseudobacter ginsenosidimutans]QEC42703.1 thioesterase [Pseudobacter ginsenosidimutans]RZS65142.1 acyl-CoA thioester hydrolase [Pseudobacter ginsenosidimutans]